MTSQLFNGEYLIENHEFVDSGYAKIIIGRATKNEIADFIAMTKRTLDHLSKTKTGKKLLDKIANSSTSGNVPGYARAKIAVVSTTSVHIHMPKGGAGRENSSDWALCMWDPTDDWIKVTAGGMNAKEISHFRKYLGYSPLIVSLFHELLHCWHCIKKVHGRGYKDEEKKTIGFGTRKWAETGALSENTLRRELDLPLRDSHHLALNFDYGAWTFRHRFKP